MKFTWKQVSKGEWQIVGLPTVLVRTLGGTNAVYYAYCGTKYVPPNRYTLEEAQANAEGAYRAFLKQRKPR